MNGLLVTSKNLHRDVSRNKIKSPRCLSRITNSPIPSLIKYPWDSSEQAWFGTQNICHIDCEKIVEDFIHNRRSKNIFEKPICWPTRFVSGNLNKENTILSSGVIFRLLGSWTCTLLLGTWLNPAYIIPRNKGRNIACEYMK